MTTDPGKPAISQAEDEIRRLERELDELRASLPAHSTPPAMILRIEELEEALESARKRLVQAGRSSEEPL